MPHRFVVATSVAAAAAVALSACSASSSAADGGLSKGPVTLNYAIWDQNQQPALKKAADEFTKSNPNVKVDIVVVPAKDYWTKLQTQLTAGAGPDVFWLNGPNFQLYASNNQLAPLDDAVGRDKGNYPKSLVDLYTYNGKLYGAPKDYDTIGVYYNKALFDAAGLAYPKAGWTWEEFQADAKKLSDPAKGVWGTASAPYGQMTFYNTILQAGGHIISSDGKTSGYDSPEALQGINFWNDLIKNGSSPSLQQITDTWPGDTFSSGKMGMFWDGSWAAGTYSKADGLKGHVGVAPLPAGPDSNVSVIHGLANVANAKSKNVGWAEKLAAFLSGKQSAEIQATTGTVIPAYNGTQQDWVKALPDLDAQIFLDEAKVAAPYPISKNTAVWNAFEATQINNIYSGKTTPEQGLQDLAKQMNDALAKE
ncbi:ABC transporter substrate-binding protein [Microbacterium rhizosphaerae]|uniref:Sugar ABC transporter substrate-binding protein n=1 Tax=Microbacterium rhizosphaerae TaxID=1678237 RepID=A0ABZ0SQ91_9MICO|nr:sugar ABC transporter substrate-binding protein [Microbacterium rhizosphaerae]WPR91499.1 sugar ABC transporter substrate-binding protein [Microbacterium rhizosphaerae]